MNSLEPRVRATLIVAMLSAAAVTAQFVGGKTIRDALFLANLDVTSLPMMVAGAAAFSIAIVFVNARVASRLEPHRLVPLIFLGSAIAWMVEWALLPLVPRGSAVLVYLHVSGVGPMLGSGFWLLATEAFDPRTAKQRFGQIAGVGTLGGLLGAGLAERVGTLLGSGAMLPILAIISIICAWQIRRLAGAGTPNAAVEPSPELAPDSVRSGLRALRGVPYLSNLAALVLLGTLGAALLDYVFKAQAVATFGRDDSLLRFFAAFYAVTGVISFVLQTSASRYALERFGLAVSIGTPSFALLAGSLGALFGMGLSSTALARGGESIFRSSLFRSGYELFYTPIAPGEKRAAKSIIDVGFDRLGDMVGGSLIRAVLVLAPVLAYQVILSLAAVCAAAALVLASRLNRGYIQTLERNLRNRALTIDLADATDMTTRTTIMRMQPGSAGHIGGSQVVDTAVRVQYGSAGLLDSLDPEVQEIVALRSRDRGRVLSVLQRDIHLTPALVPHVIPLLAWEPVAEAAIEALREVAESHVGQLADALLDPDQDFAIRRRLARLLSVCSTQRAVDVLLRGLDDPRFEVRFRCGHSLGAIRARQPDVRIEAERVFDFVRREVTVSRPVWESHRLLDRIDPSEQHEFVDDFLRDRASQSLAHVFTLLSLVLSPEPLQIAFRGLHAGDPQLRGTALEYLEGVLPRHIREPLWPFLDDHRPAARIVRPSDHVLEDLLRSNVSIMINLKELKDRAEAPDVQSGGDPPGDVPRRSDL